MSESVSQFRISFVFRANRTPERPITPMSPSLATQLGDGFASPVPSPSVKSVTRSYYQRSPSNESEGGTATTPTAKASRPQSASVVDFGKKFDTDSEVERKHENPQGFVENEDDASDSDLQPLDWDSMVDSAPAAPHQSPVRHLSPSPRSKFERTLTPYAKQKARVPGQTSYIPSPIRIPSGSEARSLPASGGHFLATPPRPSGGACLASQSVAFPVGSKQRRRAPSARDSPLALRPSDMQEHTNYAQDNFLFEEASHGNQCFQDTSGYQSIQEKHQNEIHNAGPSCSMKNLVNAPPTSRALSRNGRHRAPITHLNATERDRLTKPQHAHAHSGFGVSPSKGIQSADLFSSTPMASDNCTVASSPGGRKSRRPKRYQCAPKISQTFFPNTDKHQDLEERASNMSQQYSTNTCNNHEDHEEDAFAYSPRLGLQSSGMHVYDSPPQEPSSFALPKARVNNQHTPQVRKIHVHDPLENVNDAFSRHSPVLGVQSASVYERFTNTPPAFAERKLLNGAQNRGAELVDRSYQKFGNEFENHSPKLGVRSVGAFNTQPFDNFTVASSPGVRRARTERKKASRVSRRSHARVHPTRRDTRTTVPPPAPAATHSPEVGPVGLANRDRVDISPSNNTVVSLPSGQRSQTESGRRSKVARRKQSTSRESGEFDVPRGQTPQSRRAYTSNVPHEFSVNETPMAMRIDENETSNSFQTEMKSVVNRIRPMTRRRKPMTTTRKRFHTMQPGMFRKYKEQHAQMHASGLVHESPKTPAARESRRPTRGPPTNSYEADTEASPERCPMPPHVVLPEPVRLSFDLVENEPVSQGASTRLEEVNEERKPQAFENYLGVSAHTSAPAPRQDLSSRRTSLRIYSTPGHSDHESPPFSATANRGQPSLQPPRATSYPVSVLSPMASLSETQPSPQGDVIQATSSRLALESPSLALEEKQRSDVQLVPRRVSNTSSSNGSSSRYLMRNPERAQDSPYR